MKTPSYRRYLEFACLCLLAIGLLWWFGRKLDWGEVRDALTRADWRLLAVGTLVISFAYLLRAYRWGALLGPLGRARLRDLFIATTVGFGAVFLIGRAGEVVRPVVLPMRDQRIRPSAAIVTIMIERIYDMIAVVILFALNLLWFNPSTDLAGQLPRVRIAGVVLLIVSLLGVASLAWFRKTSVASLAWLRKTFERWAFIPSWLSRVVIRMVEQLARALRVLVDLRELAVTVGWTALVWLSIAFANFLVFRAFGLRFGLTETIFVLGWSLVGSLVPTPGGAAGAFHAATAAGLVLLGVARETAAAVSIILHLIDFGPALAFGVFYLIRGDINLSQLRALMASQRSNGSIDDHEEVTGDDFIGKPLKDVAATD